VHLGGHLGDHAEAALTAQDHLADAASTKCWVEAGRSLSEPGGELPPLAWRPVTARIALHNLFTCGLCADEVRLIQGLSTDPHIRQQAADRQYAVVVIDGDHSAEGVLADLWWVETICLPGAVVIMDDYGDRRWRGVETAVGAYHADGGLLELVGTASTSAYLRMRQ